MGQRPSVPMAAGEQNYDGEASKKTVPSTVPQNMELDVPKLELTDEHREILLVKTTESLNSLLNEIFMNKPHRRNEKVGAPQMRMNTLMGSKPEVQPRETVLSNTVDQPCGTAQHDVKLEKDCEFVKKQQEQEQSDAVNVSCSSDNVKLELETGSEKYRHEEKPLDILQPSLSTQLSGLDVEQLRTKIRSVLDDPTINEYQVLSSRVKEVIDMYPNHTQPMDSTHEYQGFIDQIISSVKYTLGYDEVTVAETHINTNEKDKKEDEKNGHNVSMDLQTEQTVNSATHRQPGPSVTSISVSSHLGINQNRSSLFPKPTKFVVEEAKYLKTACGVGMYHRPATPHPTSPENHKNWDDIVKISHIPEQLDPASPLTGPTIRHDSKPRDIMQASPFKHLDYAIRTADTDRFDLMAQIRSHRLRNPDSYPSILHRKPSDKTQPKSKSTNICDRSDLRPSSVTPLIVVTPSSMHPIFKTTHTPSPNIVQRTPETVRKRSPAPKGTTSPYWSTPHKKSALGHHTRVKCNYVRKDHEDTTIKCSPLGRQNGTPNLKRVLAHRI